MVTNSTNEDFEPYTYGASPNPNYPQPISVVTGTQEVAVRGKNIINIPDQSDYTSNGVSTIISNGVMNISGTPTSSWCNITTASTPMSINIKANKTITFWRNQTYSKPLSIRLYHTDNTLHPRHKLPHRVSLSYPAPKHYSALLGRS